MELIRRFEKLNKDDAEIAGGKGASLGEMTQSGIPIPPGFVVLSDSFEQFLRETDLNVEIDAILDTVDHKEIHTVEHASEKIQALILRSEMPEDIKQAIQNNFAELGAEYVAVRSSATAEDSSEAAWAGQLDSFLNTTETTLLQNVRRCWASLFTPRAIFYRFEKDLHKQKISVAVVVQKMVNSEKSGIAFSVHPVTEDRNQLIIEAGFGLGEAIVSGSVTPDSYVVTKEPREIIDINVSNQNRAMYRVEGGGNEWKDLGNDGEKQVLDEADIKELADLIIKIENHYSFPCDIEWAYEQNTFYITQSRPITTLLAVSNESIEASSGIDWVNLWEAPAQLVLAQAYFEIYNKGNPYKEIYGCFPDNAFYPYIKGSIIAHHSKSEIEKSGEVGLKAHQTPGLISHIVEESEKIIEQMHIYGKEVFEADFDQLSQAKLLEYFEEFYHLVTSSTAYYKCCNDEFQVGAAGELEKFFESKGLDANTIAEYVYLVAVPTELSTLDKYELEVNELAQSIINEGVTEGIKSRAETISKDYGWIGTGEGGKYWDTDFVLSSANESSTQGLQLLQERAKEKRDYSIQQKQKIEDVFNELDAPKEIRAIANQLGLLAHTKLESRIAWTSRDTGLHKVYEQITKRFSVPKEDLKIYKYEDVVTLLKENVKLNESVVSQRKQIALFYVIDGKSEFLQGDEAQRLMEREVKKDDFSDIDSLKGIVARKGKVTGKVVIVSPLEDQAKELAKVEVGDILVTGMTRPHMMPAMQKAAAFVTDEGGITCHAAIIAREMNKPCIIATRIATKFLKDGDMVEVDADNGVVHRISSEMNNSIELSTDDYIRMFAGKAFSYILTDLFLTYYGTIGVLSSQDEETWMSFLPKTTREKTLVEGQKLYTSGDEYKKYHQEFYDYMRSASEYFESVLSKANITTEEVEKFFEIASKHWVYYSKTEFFYTDGLDLDKMVISVQDFDKLKLDGRSYLNKLVFEETGYVKTLLTKLSEQVGISKAGLLNYTIVELNELLRQGSKVDNSLLSSREVFFAGKDISLFGDKARDLVNKFLTPYREVSNLIRGTIAHRGRVTAKARVLLPEFKDFDKIAEAVKLMQDGEILVAETTSPDIIAACKKASAIITNQGGMLSHAAIVSRELGIPCIIGTDKDVILNIKTGDLLEVDADQGIIKILK